MRGQEARLPFKGFFFEVVLSDFSGEHSSPDHAQLLERLEMQSVASSPTTQLNPCVLGEREQFGQQLATSTSQFCTNS